MATVVLETFVEMLDNGDVEVRISTRRFVKRANPELYQDSAWLEIYEYDEDDHELDVDDDLADVLDWMVSCTKYFTKRGLHLR